MKTIPLAKLQFVLFGPRIFYIYVRNPQKLEIHWNLRSTPAPLAIKLWLGEDRWNYSAPQTFLKRLKTENELRVNDRRNGFCVLNYYSLSCFLVLKLCEFIALTTP